MALVNRYTLDMGRHTFCRKRGGTRWERHNNDSMSVSLEGNVMGNLGRVTTSCTQTSKDVNGRAKLRFILITKPLSEIPSLFLLSLDHRDHRLAPLIASGARGAPSSGRVIFFPG